MTADRPQQVAKVVAAVIPGVDGLAQERDLSGARVSERPDFIDHCRKIAAPLRPARVRNHAEGAAIIAAALHRHELGRPGNPHRRDILVVEFRVAHPGARLGMADQLGKIAVRIGADDQVHLGHPLEQYRTQALRHAAHDAQHGTGALVALELSHPADDPLLCVVTHRAGIHQQHVCVLGLVGRLVSGPSQDAEHQLGIGHVHLAAVGLDVYALHGRTEIPIVSRVARSEKPEPPFRQTSPSDKSNPARSATNRLEVPIEIPVSLMSCPRITGNGSRAR